MLRYNRWPKGRGGGPLWVKADGALDATGGQQGGAAVGAAVGGDGGGGPCGSGAGVPKCERCGRAREFEFQVMPQLLYYLRADAMPPDPPQGATHGATHGSAASAGVASAGAAKEAASDPASPERDSGAVGGSAAQVAALKHLAARHLDWGALVVYTCPVSCGDGGGYLKEHVHRQSPL